LWLQLISNNRFMGHYTHWFMVATTINFDFMIEHEM
jgi:hypothetical protein